MENHKMLKLTLTTENGPVEATFNNFEEYDSFMKELKSRKAKAAEEKKARDEAEARELQAKAKKMFEDIHGAAKALVTKCMENGVPPDLMMRVLKFTVLELMVRSDKVKDEKTDEADKTVADNTSSGATSVNPAEYNVSWDLDHINEFDYVNDCW